MDKTQMDVSSENDTAEYKAPERLLKFLVKNAERHQYDFNDESASHLLQEVYMSLLNYDESNWKYLVKEGPVSVTSKFRLPEVQKRQFGDEITDLGSEVCGHVFRNGEPVYRCRTCAMDNTCVLCARCFRNTNHDGHETHVSIPTDSNGICDCGDPEAWKVPLGCSIHASKDDGPKAEDVLPRELQESIHSTISTVLDFILDVFNCSPINLKATQTVDSVLEDERRSRLSETKYFVEDEQCSVFRVMLWNDEKHKFDDVIRLTMEAMNTNDWSFGEQVAQRVNSIGRFAVSTSRSIDDLLDIAQVFAKVDLAVNVRSARDFFRENDCGTLILWLYDLMESQICGYKGFLRDIICDELVKCWNSGLKHPTYDEPNFNDNPIESVNDDDSDEELFDAEGILDIFRNAAPGLDLDDLQQGDDDLDVDDELDVEGFRQMNDGLNVEDFRPVVLRNIRQLINERRRMHSALPTERITLPGDYWKSPREEGLKVLSMAESPYSRLRLDYFFLYDLKYWKNLRNLLSELYVVPLNQNLQFKRAMAIRFSILYKTLSRAFLFADREPEHSVTFLSVQFFTTPSLAELLVLRYDFLTTANSSLYSLFTCQKRSRSTETGGPSIEINQRALVSQRNAMLFGDLGYLLMHPSVMGLVHSDKRFIKQYSDLFHLFQGILCHVRAVHEHVEWDSSIYKLLFVIYSVAKLGHKVACCYSSAPYEDMLYACNYLIDFILQPVHQNKKETEPSACLPAADYNETTPLVEHKVSSDSVSFYHPLHWVLSGIMKFMNPSRLSTWDDRTKLALMDHPLRAFVWLAQIDVGLWVRNGAKVRGMAHHYKHLTIYDYAFDKDLLLVQLMVSTLPPDLALNAIVQRFELTDWVASVSYEHSVYDSERLPLMVEKLLLMIVGLITEREQLQQLSVEELIKNRIAQQLVFGPLAYSSLLQRISEQYTEYSAFDSILESVTTYKAPGGVYDYGVYTLKDEYYDRVNPFSVHYSKNQREEAAVSLKKRLARHTMKNENSIVLVPNIQLCFNGSSNEDIFLNLTHSLTFIKIIACALKYVLNSTYDLINADDIVCAAVNLLIIGTKLDEQCHTNRFSVNCCTNRFPYSVLDERSNKLETYDLTIAEILYVLPSGSLVSLSTECEYLLGFFRSHAEEAYNTMVQNSKLNFSSSDNSHEDEESLRRQKKRVARERQLQILEQMKQQQASFLAQNKDFEMEEDEENENESSSKETDKETRFLEYSSGNCLLCQEECNDRKPYGVLGLLQNSSLLRMTPLNNPTSLKELQLLPQSFDAEYEDRPFGFKQEPASLTPCKTRVEGGFPINNNTSDVYALSCSHLMHITCYKNYTSTSASNPTFLLFPSTRTGTRNLRYFTCPLCKSLCNILLPVLWEPRPEKQMKRELYLASFELWLGNQLKHINTGIMSVSSFDISSKCERIMSTFDASVFRSSNAHRLHSVSPIEIVGLYDKLAETLGALHAYPTNLRALNYSLLEKLLNCFSYTLSCIEISSRGMKGTVPGKKIWFSHLNQSMLCFLNTLAESVKGILCYYANRGDSQVLDILLMRRLLLMKLFPNNPKNQSDEEQDLSNLQPSLLESDLFSQFVHLTILDDADNDSLNEYTIMYYLASIPRTIVSMIKLFAETKVSQPACSYEYTPSEISGFTKLCAATLQSCGMQSYLAYLDDKTIVYALMNFVEVHELILLRKLALLYYCRFYVNLEDYTDDEDLALPELIKLSKAMCIPSLPEVYSLYENDNKTPLKDVLMSWGQHFARGQVHDVRIEYPGIYELLKLPYKLETFIDVLQDCLCSVCKKKPVSPAICLNCGSIVCFGSYSDPNHSGEDDEWDEHAKVCSKNIGLCFIIKICGILHLDTRLKVGTLADAPYLDVHGETDFRLHRGRPQFLNQKRYDYSIRTPWLHHGILSLIARRIDLQGFQGGAII